MSALAQANGQGPSEDPAVRQKAARLILPFLNQVRVRPGEVYDLPPGTVHAIGRGVRIFEIQASSDTTYRVWDWNRPDPKKLKEGKRQFRELHLERARDVLDFHALPPEHYRRASRKLPASVQGAALEELLVREADGRFAASRLRFDAAGAAITLAAGFSVLTAVAGSAVVQAGGARESLSCGQSVLIPAAAPAAVVRCEQAPCEVVRSFVPERI
ncbi:MAG: hypothetical protein JO102_06280 [Elusimicrobia bacterium]|nr:hypothetical protein [Elusimicrobiota bacterium]